MLICHKCVASNEAAVLQVCHVSDVHAKCSHIVSVCHASVVRGCVPLSTSSSLIYHFWFLKHHHSAATLTTTGVVDAFVIPMKTACMPSK